MPFTPYDAATDSIARARAMLAHAPSAPPALRDDVRRMSVVMGIAALDTYMHRLIVHRVYDHKTLPKGVANLTLNFSNALKQADESAAAARAAPRNIRPRVALKRMLRDRLLRDSFQNFEAVGDALAMAGLTKPWSKIGGQMTPPQKSVQIRSRLNAIVRRRNQIAHEGDYERLDRPQNARTNPIAQAEASSNLDYLADLIDAIHSVY
jgi:hypothetical protein